MLRSMRSRISLYFGLWLGSTLFLLQLLGNTQPVKAFWGAKFEPTDGKIYSGAGWGVSGIANIINKGDPARKPYLVVVYDGIHFLNSAENNYNLMSSHNFFPGARLQIGLQLPLNNFAELSKVSDGTYDVKIRRLARLYKSFNRDIFLRIGYEFDGSWNGYDAVAYVNAYRRIVDIFRAEGVNNVAFVWNSYTPYCPAIDATTNLCTTMKAWYPGDSYVDWFSFNVWTKGFNASGFMSQANFHHKPVLIGEGSYSWAFDGCNPDIPGCDRYSFDQWINPYFTSVRDSGVKGFAYVNINWPVYPAWTNWTDGEFTKNSSYVTLYNQEMLNTKYIFRDSSYYNPLPLFVKAARNAPPGTNGLQWTSSVYDNSAIVSPYNYSAINAYYYYGDGWQPYWANPTGTNFTTVDITVPANSSAYVDLNAYAYTSNSATNQIAHDIYVGNRKVFSLIKPIRPVKFKYLPTDIQNGHLMVKVSTPSNSHIRFEHVGIQTISQSAPTAPSNLQATSTSGTGITLSWSSVPGASLYNVYRDGELMGMVQGTTFVDYYVLAGINHTYNVSAWHNTQGEGNMSASVSATSEALDGLAVNRNQNTGAIDIFMRGTDNVGWTRQYNGSVWSYWKSQGGILTSAPAVTRQQSTGQVNLFARGSNNLIYIDWLAGGSWSGWQFLGSPPGGATSAPAVDTKQSSGQINLFARGGDNAIWINWYVNGTWSGWYTLGSPPGGATSAPAVTINQSTGQINVFARGSDNAIWINWYVNGTWSGWYTLSTPTTASTSAPAVATLQSTNTMYLYTRGTDNNIYTRSYANGVWSAWSLFGAPPSGALSTLGVDINQSTGQIDVFVRGGRNITWNRWYSGGNWSNWYSMDLNP